jgi:hypothetical protein
VDLGSVCIKAVWFYKDGLPPAWQARLCGAGVLGSRSPPCQCGIFALNTETGRQIAHLWPTALSVKSTVQLPLVRRAVSAHQSLSSILQTLVAPWSSDSHGSHHRALRHHACSVAATAATESVGRPRGSWSKLGVGRHMMLPKDVRNKVALPEPAAKEADSPLSGPRLMSIGATSRRAPTRCLDADQLLPLALRRRSIHWLQTSR